MWQQISINSVPKDYRMAAYGLGSTDGSQSIKLYFQQQAAGILSGIILGLARAFGEALAVAMVIGQTTAFQRDFLHDKESDNGNRGTDGKCDRRW